MRNQPQAHVADERAAFEAWAKKEYGDGPELEFNGLRYAYSHVQKSWRTWQAARAAIPAGADVCVNSAALADAACPTCHGTGQVCVGTSGQESDGNAPLMEPCGECGYFDAIQTGANSAASLPVDLKWDDKVQGYVSRPFTLSDIAAGAPAETPKPLTIQQITDIWNATEKEWLAAVKVALDPADAGNLTVHFVRAIERAIAAQPAPAPATDARDALDAARYHWLRDPSGQKAAWQLEAMDKKIDAAMLSANSPREAL